MEEMANHQFVIGSGEGIKIGADYGGQVYRRDTFHSQTSIQDVLRIYYFSKRLPKRVKEFLDEWYAMLDAQFAIVLTNAL